MADITNPQVIKFTTESIRPMCEKTRAWWHEMLSIETIWFAGMNTLIPNDNSVILEGTDDGRTPLTGSDVHNIMSILINMKQEYNDQVIEKGTVRPFSADPSSITTNT